MSPQKQALIEAEQKAVLLFDEIENRNLIQAGKTEKELNTEVFDLAFELFGIKKYWHKRIVRAGKNTLLPYRENPPNLTLQKDDILFFDFGPIFEDWEADFARTYVIGNDPMKLKLQQDVETAWQECKAWFDQQTELTGAELFNYCVDLAPKYGWEFGGVIAGHIIGNFPHEDLGGNMEGADVINHIHPNNHTSMFDLNQKGEPKIWILEIHFIDRKLEIGGFVERLLN